MTLLPASEVAARRNAVAAADTVSAVVAWEALLDLLTQYKLTHLVGADISTSIFGILFMPAKTGLLSQSQEVCSYGELGASCI